MSSFGLAGRQPFGDFTTSASEVILQLLKDNYDQTITGIPLSEVRFDEPFSNGDFFIWADKIYTFSHDNDIGQNEDEQDIYINLHVYVRSLFNQYTTLDTYDNVTKHNAVYYLDRFESFIRKTIMQYRRTLITEGIIRVRFVETRDVGMNSIASATIPKNEQSLHQADIKRRIIQLELKVEYRYLPQ